jgi:hypothetical protein
MAEHVVESGLLLFDRGYPRNQHRRFCSVVGPHDDERPPRDKDDRVQSFPEDSYFEMTIDT